MQQFMLLAFSLLAFLLNADQLYAEKFTFAVRHDHLFGSCHGKLIISEKGIEYDTDNKEDRRLWSYQDIQRIDIVSKQAINILTYEDQKIKLGADREFKFVLTEGAITSDVYNFLLTKIEKPLVIRVVFSSTDIAFEIPAKHRHRLGGCQGVLKIADQQIIYETDNREDSRIWFYKDIQSIGLTDPFHFRVTTFVETYTFDLKEQMRGEVYDYIWKRIYKP